MVNIKLLNKINVLINYNILLCSRYKRDKHYSENIKQLQHILDEVL